MIAIALLRGLGATAVKGIALVIGVLTFVISLGLYTGFNADIGTFQLGSTPIEWIPS